MKPPASSQEAKDRFPHKAKATAYESDHCNINISNIIPRNHTMSRSQGSLHNQTPLAFDSSSTSIPASASTFLLAAGIGHKRKLETPTDNNLSTDTNFSTGTGASATANSGNYISTGTAAPVKRKHTKKVTTTSAAAVSDKNDLIEGRDSLLEKGAKVLVYRYGSSERVISTVVKRLLK
jgi:hypothetical protein